MAWSVQVTYLYSRMIKLLDLLLEVTTKPKAIFLAGPAGSGKSYVSKQLLPSDLKVGGNIDLRNTPLSKKYSEEEIRQMVKVDGDIYL